MAPQAESTALDNISLNDETRTALEPSHHYQQLPIHNLPPEVLLLVFLEVAGFRSGYYTRLLCLRMVCKYWMEAIDSTPELWKSISTRLHPELQAMIIQNSGNHLLDVKYDETYWERDVEKESERAAFAGLMESSASRWQALKYRRAHNSGGDNWLFSLPLHSLECIEIDGPTWWDQHSTLDAPKLSYVDVRCCSLNWRSLSGLQVLILASTDPTLNELAVILKASPGLRHLSLSNTLLRMGTEGAPNYHTNDICLPQLRTLHMYGALADSSSLLLGWIKAPSLETLDVKVQHTRATEDFTQLCEAAGRHIGAFPLPQDQNAQVLIRAQNSEMMFSIGRRCIVIWSIGTNGAGDTPSYIASAMKTLDRRICEEVRILHISGLDSGKIGECLRNAHSRFPRIDEILVMDRKTELGPVVQHLSSPSQVGLAEEWLFPKLAKLELHLSCLTNSDVGAKFVELFRRRREADRTEEITNFRITIFFGKIDTSMVEILRQSVMLLDLTVVGGVYVRGFLWYALSLAESESHAPQQS